MYICWLLSWKFIEDLVLKFLTWYCGISNLQNIFSFLPTGSNLLLQRVMIKKGENYSNLNFLSFDSEAALCTASYVSIHFIYKIMM